MNTSLTGSRSRVPLLALAGVLVAGGATVAILRTAGNHDADTTSVSSGTSATSSPSNTGPTREPSTYRVEIATDPGNAKLELDGEPAGSGKLSRSMPIDGTSHTIVARATGYEDATVHFRDRAPARLLSLVKIAPPPPQPPSSDSHPSGRDDGHVDGTRPSKPGRPGKPGKPGKPGNPAKPGKPAKPDQPANPTKGDPFPNDAPVIE